MYDSVTECCCVAFQLLHFQKVEKDRKSMFDTTTFWLQMLSAVGIYHKYAEKGNSTNAA